MKISLKINFVRECITCILFFLCTNSCLFGQKLSIVSLTETIEDCPSNGSISVFIAGGTAPFCYEITPCSSNCKNCIPQKNYTFNSLTSGVYTISVSDNSNPVQVVSQEVTVVGAYLPPTLQSIDNDCTLSAYYIFGKKPFKYRIKEVNGNFGAYQNDSTFVVTKTGNYTLEITDACGSVRTNTSYYAVKVLALKIDQCSTKNGIVSAILIGSGGTKPYKFKMITPSDSTNWFTSGNIDFPKPCGLFDYVMEDACGRRIRINGEQCLQLDLKVLCGDCVKGEFTLLNTDGTAPIRYYFVDMNGKQTPNPNGINNPVFNNVLSEPCGKTNFIIKDACGLTGKVTYICLGAAIILKTNKDVVAKVSNTYKTQNPRPPYIISCETCIPKQTFTTNDSTLFKNIIGNQEFSITDSCGAKVVIKPNNNIEYKTSIDCPNFEVKSFILTGPKNCYIFDIESQYILYDSKGVAIDSNTTGEFQNYKTGIYTVKIVTPAWDIVAYRTINLANSPFWMWAEVATIKNNQGLCKPVWQLHAFSAEKTIFLSGGPSNFDNLAFSSSTLSNRGDTAVQRQNYFIELEPGTYSLRADCNTDTIFTLPKITTNQLQFFAPLCPNDQNFKLGNLNDVPYWTSFYENLGMKIPVSNADKDFITLNCLYPTPNCKPNFNGLFSQPSGKIYTAYLYTGNFQNACPVDTLTFKLEPKNYKLLDSLTLRYFYCNGNKNNGTLYAQPNGGAPPYTFQILDKPNGVAIKEVKGDVKDLKFNNLTPGLYNFKIKDTCGNEYPIQRTIQQDFKLNAFAKGNCDGKTITLSATKVPGATYNWKSLDSDQSIKNGLDQWEINHISNSLSAKYQLYIQYLDCKIFDTILTVTSVPALNVTTKPLDPKNCLAQIQSISTGSTLPYSFQWSSGEKTANISDKISGTYTITVTDSRGCTTSSSIVAPQYVANKIEGTPDTTICNATNIQLGIKNTDTFKTFIWFPNTNLSSNTIINPLAKVNQSISYKIVATDNQGCTSEGSVFIKILSADGIKIPLAFTPDADGLNDVFEPYVTSGRFTRMVIYNRWGNKVYDDNKAWNGTLEGVPSQADTYLYRIFYENGTCESKILQGDVSLLR